MTAEDKIINDTESKAATESAPGLFSPRRRVKAKIDELEKTIADLKSEVEAERDKRLRLLAEYDNYRRRTNSEYGQMLKSAGERIIVKLLPALDDFSRFSQHHPLDQTGETPVLPILQAVDLIQRKFVQTLASEGLTPIESLGQQFDASCHEAVAELPAAGVAEGTIIAEAEKGYRLGDKIIRHAKVVICKAADDADESAE